MSLAPYFIWGWCEVCLFQRGQPSPVLLVGPVSQPSGSHLNKAPGGWLSGPETPGEATQRQPTPCAWTLGLCSLGVRLWLLCVSLLFLGSQGLYPQTQSKATKPEGSGWLVNN